MEVMNPRDPKRRLSHGCLRELWAVGCSVKPCESESGSGRTQLTQVLIEFLVLILSSGQIIPVSTVAQFQRGKPVSGLYMTFQFHQKQTK
jgi:hypothetical protein